MKSIRAVNAPARVTTIGDETGSNAATRKVDAASVRSSQGIPVEFRLPTTALALGDERAQGQVRWVLEVIAPLPGTDFSAIFPVDVRAQRG